MARVCGIFSAMTSKKNNPHKNNRAVGPVLITDLGNVVIFFDRRRVAAGFQRFAPEKTIDEIDDLINKSAAGIALLEQFETGRINADLYRRGIEHLLGTRIPADDFWRVHTCLFTPNMPVIDLWKKLRAEGKVQKIIALTDTDPVRLQAGLSLLESCGLALDGAIASYQVGCRKPNPAIFQDAIDLWEAQPNQCVFVDDNAAYAAAARQQGMAGICYVADSPQAQKMLLADLHAAGFVA